MKALFCLLVSVFIGLSAFANAGQASNVYMVAKNKVTDTTFTQVVFFQSDEISTMGQCEKEVEYGLSFGWQVYTHLLRKVHGFGYSTQYSCAESEQLFSIWIGQGSVRKVIYLVTNENGHLKVKPQQSYAACMKQVRTIQGDETPELFCGRSSQKIIE